MTDAKKAKWEKKGTNDGVITFEIGTDDIEKGLDKAFEQNKNKISVPGFRKGKVPRKIFDEKYGEEALYQDALNILLPKAYERALKETSISPVGQPQVSVKSLEKGKPWVLTAEVSVKPEVKLGKYKGLTVPKQPTTVTKKEVDDQLEKMRQSQAELVLVDRPAKKGDTVTIDFDGSVDGKPFAGGKANNYSLELGSGQFIPGFEDQLIGHKAGDDVDVKVTFPKDYQEKSLAGKEAIFKTKIHEVKEKQLPKLDDDFAKDVDEDVDTLAELKDKIKKQIKEQKENAAHDAIENDALEKAADNATIKDIPEVMFEDDAQRQMDQYLAGMQQQGINPETYFKLTGTSKDDLKKQFKEGADRRVRVSLTLEAIVDAEDIQPTEKEVKDEIAKLAKQYGMKEDAVKNALSDEMLKHDIGIQKAVDIVVDSVKQSADAKPAGDKKAAKKPAKKSEKKDSKK